MSTWLNSSCWQIRHSATREDSLSWGWLYFWQSYWLVGRLELLMLKNKQLKARQVIGRVEVDIWQSPSIDSFWYLLFSYWPLSLGLSWNYALYKLDDWLIYTFSSCHLDNLTFSDVSCVFCYCYQNDVLTVITSAETGLIDWSALTSELRKIQHRVNRIHTL